MLNKSKPICQRLHLFEISTGLKLNPSVVTLEFQRMDTIPVLCHTLDKVRYFRNLLLGEEYLHVRVILGGENVIALLQIALDDVKDGVVNQLVIMDWVYQIPLLAVKSPTRETPPILVYIRYSHDEFVKALDNEYGDCEIVKFGKDPTLDP